ncbi:MAG: peptidylprolyl isomerase [Clostridiales bacterium]|nr:peptidylprolyl isomerase [Clostridiales bacterium]
MKISKVVLTAAALSLVMTGCGAGTKTAVEIGKHKISTNDLQYLTERYNEQIGDFDTSKKYALDSAEEAVLIYEAAQAEGVELSEEDQKTFKSSKASFMANFGGKSAYEKYIKENKISDNFINMILYQDVYQPLLEEKWEFEDPTDDELKQYMQENFLRAKHVLLKVADETEEDQKQQEANEILEQAKNGADFDKLVEEKSQDPGSTQYKDGYVFTDGDMVQSFEDGVKSIQPGEYTVVKSDYGYHVIKRLALDPSDEKFQSLFEENKSNIQSKYEQKRFKDKVKECAAQNGAEVKENEEAISAVAEPTPEPTQDPKEDPAYEDDGTTPKPEK